MAPTGGADISLSVVTVSHAVRTRSINVQVPVLSLLQETVMALYDPNFD